MDPLKRELYMRARTILKERQESCVCWALMRALGELGSSYCRSTIDSEVNVGELLKDIFPEFFALDDLKQWHLNKYMKEMYIYTAYPRQGGSASYWWVGSGLEPRLRILDCILNSH